MVFFHQPGFNASAKHNAEQQMRLLAPDFEAGGVDVVFAGHVHNYQRTKPLKFAPTKVVKTKAAKAAAKTATKTKKKTEKADEETSGAGFLVEGNFTLDEKFDGAANTRPEGIIYIVTGGGGAKLYDSDFTDQPDKWKVGGTQFITKFISDRHSFSIVDLDAKKLVLRQVDEDGKEIDKITVTKPSP
jgi:hypothetical protein